MKKRNLYAIILAASPLIDVLGAATGYPTHANLIWHASLLVAAVLLLPLTISFLERLTLRSIAPALYVVTFIIVSYFGVSFAESLKYRVLWLPIILLDFAAWYAAGYFVQERLFMRYLIVCACLFGLASLGLAQTGLIDPEQTRIIYSPDVSMAVAPAVMLSSMAGASILLLVSLMSLKKTIVACSVAAAGFAYIGSKLSGARWKSRKLVRIDPIIKWVLGSVFTLAAAAILIVVFSPYLSGTLQRFGADGEDVLRLAAASEFERLIAEFWPQGTGYYTFGYLTQDVIPYWSETLKGDILIGMSLHNSYMHYALEGGLSIVVIVLVLHWSYFRSIYRLRAWPDARPLCLVLVSWMLVAFIFGMFQQFHTSRYFFGMFGYAWGCYDRYRIGTDGFTASEAVGPT